MITPNKSVERIKTLKYQLVSIAGNPLFISLAVAITIAILFPKTEKYKITIESYEIIETRGGLQHYLCYDLNNDGATEVIQTGTNSRGDHAVTVRFMDGKYLNQWNFKGRTFESEQRVFVGDADGNGYKEIYTFSQVEDSVFLHFFEPFNPNGISAENVFIDRIEKRDGKVDFFIRSIQLCDLENNGTKSLIFSINAGFSLQPRKVYVFNPLNGDLRMTPANGTPFSAVYCVEPLTADRKILISNNYATGNLRSYMDIPYQDSSAWLKVFDTNLDFLFEPVEFPGFNRGVKVYPIYFDSELSLLVYSTSLAKCDTCDFLAMYDLTGAEIKRQCLSNHPDAPFSLLTQLINQNKLPLLYSPSSGKVYEVNDDLEPILKYQLPQSLQFGFEKYHLLDFSNDGKTDYIFTMNPSGFTLIKSDFSRWINYGLQNPNLIIPYTLGIRSNKKGISNLFQLQEGPGLFVFRISDNPFHYLKWLIVAVLYIFLFGLISLSRRLYKTQILSRQAIERQISELQMQAVGNQLNPHFIFNALNSINSFILLNKKNEGYEFGIKFSKLIREALTTSDKIMRPLVKELDFVKHYLDLESRRYNNRFEYRIDIDHAVDQQTEVPKMIIQIFAENAVKHGLSALEKGGLLHINIAKVNEELNISIKDNGIGRLAASGSRSLSTKKGFLIMEKIIALYHKLYHKQIHYKITDLEPDMHGHTGTLVEVSIEIIDTL